MERFVKILMAMYCLYISPDSFIQFEKAAAHSAVADGYQPYLRQNAR